jgi:FtsH-binding integral membrane protein
MQEKAPQPTDSTAGTGVVGFAILGCLIAGVIALFKAFVASTGLDTLLCTVGAVLAFGAVIWIYCSKRL